MDKKQKVIQALLIGLITLIVGTILIVICGVSPLTAYAMFFNGIFGNATSFAEIFVKAVPLILLGLGCAVAFKTGFFNIGAEGQFYMGALAAAAVALSVQDFPKAVAIPMIMVAGFVTGGAWALIAAVMKAKFKISEIIVTIMLNYIAINIVGIAIRTFLMDPAGSVPQTARIGGNATLSLLMPPTRLNTGIIVAIIMVVIVWIFMDKTTMGYEIKVVGFNKRAAECNGISVMKNIVISAFLSGGLAGLAGVIEVIGVQKKLLEGISSDAGYTAVLIALLASNHPIGVFFAAVGFAAMQVGASSMQRQLGVPNAIVNILMGFMVLMILAKNLLVYKKKQDK